MEALGTHQVDRGIAVAGAALSDLAEVSLLGLDQRAVGSSLVALVQLESQLAELKHRVLAHAAAVHVEEPTGATTPTTWFAAATRTTVRAARRSAHLAEALETYTVLRAGMAAGQVNVEQAEVIYRALDALPADLESWIRLEAEQTLVELAATHDAQHLRVLGDKILHVVAPEVGEAHEAKQLEDAERAAEKAISLKMTPSGDGKVIGKFVVPELVGGMLRKMMMAFVVQHQPPQQRTGPEDEHVEPRLEPRIERRATAHELGLAFCELIERLDDKDAPEVGGTGATVVVTMTLDTLHGGLAAATIDTGDRITAATARRLACEAGIIPIVLNGKGVVLDQGRRRRLFTRAQRIALVVRDKGCTAVGCQTAAWFTHAHHDDPWSVGGKTDLARGRLLCPTHHRMAHSDHYEMSVVAGNKIQFTRRT